MAPESYRDDKCTDRIDIYSLAMMMWEMITGQALPHPTPLNPTFCTIHNFLDLHTSHHDHDGRCVCLKPVIRRQLPWEGSNFNDVRHAVATAGARPEIPPDTAPELVEV